MSADCWNCCTARPVGEFEIDNWGVQPLCESCVTAIQARGHQVEEVDPEDDCE